jgi:hypothetical protein
MAKYRVQGPDGAVHVFEGPDDATPDQVTAAAEQQFGGKPATARQEAGQAPAEPGMLDRLAAGAREYAQNPIGNTVQSVADLGHGIYRGFRNITDAAGQAAYHAVGQGDRADQLIRDQRAQYDAATKDRIMAPVGEVLGGVAATLPISAAPAASAMARIGQAAGIGAGLGAAQPVMSGDYIPEKAKQIGTGALFGGIGGGVSEGIARMLNPQTSAPVRKLLDEGVDLTPGQIMGGRGQRLEQGIGSIPILGDTVRNAERRSFDSLNKAAYNRALNPIGESAAGLKAGREGIEQVGAKLGAAYDELLPKLNVRLDSQFTQDVQAIRQAADILPPAQKAQLDKLIQDEVVNKFSKSTASPGEVMKHIDSQLGAFARKFSDNLDGNNRMLADAAGSVRDALRETVVRSNTANPELSQRLSAINEGYANFVRLQKAAAAVGADKSNGVFTPAQLASAVRSMDNSVRKGGFARGDALMQDLTDAARQTMSQTVPDSGTPYRSILALLGTGAVSPGAAMGAGAMMLPYTSQGQRVAQSLLAERPQAFRRAAGLLSNGTPLIGGLAGATLLSGP